jgi:hypothetical protein
MSTNILTLEDETAPLFQNVSNQFICDMVSHPRRTKSSDSGKLENFSTVSHTDFHTSTKKVPGTEDIKAKYNAQGHK